MKACIRACHLWLAMLCWALGLAVGAMAQPVPSGAMVQNASLPKALADGQIPPDATPPTPANLPSLPTPPDPPTRPQSPSAASAQRLTAFIAEAEAWLLAGQSLPPELPKLLEPMVPGDRLLAVAYLRRLGLLQGAPLDLQRLLAPVPSDNPQGGA